MTARADVDAQGGSDEQDRSGGRTTCESCNSIDVRRWHRDGLLDPGRSFSVHWTYGGRPSGDIRARTESGVAVLIFRWRRSGDSEWKSEEQRVPIQWTACRFGGRRPWFRCPVYANGRYCGRRVAKLYAADVLFACRHCYRLAYASQQENPRMRGISQAQKIRERLGGSMNLIDYPFPEKPKWMHWQTYNRLKDRAEQAEQRSNVSMMEWFRKRDLAPMRRQRAGR